jgi:carboxyl-terminal processing protease
VNVLRRITWPRWIAVAALTAVLGFTAAGMLRAQEDLRSQLDRFAIIFYYIRNQYVDEVENKELVESAINGMLDTLDPHSVYLPRDRYAQFSEQFREDFSGIGIQFDVRDGELIVVSPLEGTPAYRLGIRAGDRIVVIDDEPVESTITAADVRRLLRGPEGSLVNVTIKRAGLEETLSFDIIRARIPQESVRYAHIIEPGVGYLRIVRFANATGRELEEALEDLRRQGMEKLIVDLRLNSGGLLQQAVEVSNHFIPTGKRIVYTKGRAPASHAEYYADATGSKYLDEPLIMLIDHGSASASEILSGAVQDLDRGLVVGTNSFGKGLVQNQMRLRDGSALLLTVAKYYTPSGRLIQRDYEDEEAYRTEIWEQDAEPDSVLAKRPKFTTVGGRTVYGGGGIRPDVIIPGTPITPKAGELEQTGVFFETASELAPAARGRYVDFEDFLESYAVSDADLEVFWGEVHQAEMELSDEDWEANYDYIKLRIKAEIAGNLYGRDASYRVNITGDEQLQEALGLFPEASRLLTQAEGIGAARRN